MMRLIIRRTKLLKTRNSSSDDNHDDLWELIPWYVNGTLSSEQYDAVKKRMVNNHDFALEVARQQQLAKHVKISDPFEAPVSRSWEMLRAQIEAEKTSQQTSIQSLGVAWEIQGRVSSLEAPAQSHAFWQLRFSCQRHPIALSQTLTRTDINSQATIKFQIAPNVDAEALPTILSRYGLEIQSGTV